MKKYGLIGFPLTHSFSKKYFAEKFEKEGIADVSFHNFPLTSIDEFPQVLRSNPTLQGLNVTIPYKEQVLQYLDHLSEEVKETRAANCIKIGKDGLVAYNTDIIGFRDSFVKKLKPGIKNALVLGSGGSSKAVQYVLDKLGIDFLVVSRTIGNKPGFIGYNQLSKEMLNDFTVIINCTPLGMYPDESTFPDIPYSYLSPNHYLFDLVYNPAKTQFLKKGEEQGALTENGYEMLKLQAEASWKIWNEE
jgi:shikimate dehydrogenase